MSTNRRKNLIKDFRPKIKDLETKYNQGYYRPINPEKYIGDVTKIIYRSSWELQFCKYCDLNSNVLYWSSEPFSIEYENPIDNTLHNYYVDFYIKVKTKNEEIKEYLVEIKPYSKTQRPILENKDKVHYKTLRKYTKELEEYIINQAKFKAGLEFAKRKNLNYIVLTDKDLINKNII